MKGFKVISSGLSYKILKKEIKFDRNVAKKDSINLKRKGYFNGDILGCTRFYNANHHLTLVCAKVPFFKFMTRRKDHSLPTLVNVNAIMQINNKILLIKRGSEVFSYRSFWDFPAGLVFHNEDLIYKLKNRILNDTKIEEKYYKIEKRYIFGASKKYASFFFFVKLKMKNPELNNMLKDSKEKITLVDKRKMDIFLKKNKTVFPEVLRKITS